MNIVKEFKGYSGCKIYLCEDNGKSFVRKYSKDIAYNLRLENQMKKQKMLYDRCEMNIPKIIGNGIEKGISFFDMDYVDGENALVYFSKASLEEIEEVLNKVFASINNLKKESVENKNNIYDASLEKFKEITEKIKLEPKLTGELFEKLALLKEVDLPSSLCHGDMTFDNILVDRNKNIFFIDLLDNYYSSHWFDIATLFQNIEKDHYKTFYPNMHISAEKKEFILKQLNSLCQKNDKDYLKVHNTLMMLKFLRILPYAVNQEHFQYVLKQVEYYKNA